MGGHAAAGRTSPEEKLINLYKKKQGHLKILGTPFLLNSTLNFSNSE
jgi:hypothetical protein